MRKLLRPHLALSAVVLAVGLAVVGMSGLAGAAASGRLSCDDTAQTGATVSCSFDDQAGAITDESWDLNEDGTFGDASGTSATTSFGTAGQHTVSVQYTDPATLNQATDTVTVDVTAPPPPPNTNPTASITGFSPTTPHSGNTVTFNGSGSDPDAGDSITGYLWALANGSCGAQPSNFSSGGTTFTTSALQQGTYCAWLKVTDANGGTSAAVSQQIRVADNATGGSFTWSPAQPVAGQTITFHPTATDPDGIKSEEWDFNGDGNTDQTVQCPFGSCPDVQLANATQGQYSVVLTVIDDNNNFATLPAQNVFVGQPANAQPIPSFTFSPATPVAGQPVTFTSTSTDPDGTITDQWWDLDGDGFFDVIGATATRTFTAAGDYTVKLRVKDNRGDLQEISRTITVAPAGTPITQSNTPPSQNTPPTQQPTIVRPKLISPFPVVRIAGRLTSRGARVTLLRVKAPTGARVYALCVGGRRHGCPYKDTSSISRKGSARLRVLERSLRAGAKIKIFVTQKGRIGKYTSITIRKGKAPSRRDLCTSSLKRKPIKCPS